MPRQFSFNVDANDLDYTIEYLMLLSRSTRASANNVSLYGGNIRIELYKAAIRLEEALLTKHDSEFLEALQRICLDVEGIIRKAMPIAAIRKMKTAIRQKRHQNPYYNRITNRIDDAATD